KGPTKRIQRFCMACMDGDYPTGDVTPNVLRSIEAERCAETRRQERGRPPDGRPAYGAASPSHGGARPSRGGAGKPGAPGKSPAPVGGKSATALDAARRAR